MGLGEHGASVFCGIPARQLNWQRSMHGLARARFVRAIGLTSLAGLRCRGHPTHHSLSDHERLLMTLIETPFGFSTTAMQVVAGLDLRGRNAVVTGGASGIVYETARALASASADVILAVRRLSAGVDAAELMRARSLPGRVAAAQLDLAEPESIRAFTRTAPSSIDILVNNAAVMATPEAKTSNGSELQFATNHLGHFSLTVQLLSALTSSGSARVVCVGSRAHMRSPVIFDDLHFRFRRYDPWLAYGQSKTANVLFAVGANPRWSKEGISVNALTPGVADTRLHRHVPGGLKVARALQKTPEQAAATPVLLASHPLLTGVGGRYFANCNETPVVHERTTDHTGVAPYALSADNAERLWDSSLRATGLEA